MSDRNMERDGYVPLLVPATRPHVRSLLKSARGALYTAAGAAGLSVAAFLGAFLTGIPAYQGWVVLVAGMLLTGGAGVMYYVLRALAALVESSARSADALERMERRSP